MDFNPKDFEIKEQVEIADVCRNGSHFRDLLIWGMCYTCRRTFNLPDDSEKVFARAEQLKKLGV